MYLDPGFGGMLLQALVAIAAAGGAVLFAIRKRVREFFSKNKKADSEGGTDNANSDAQDQNDDDNVVDMISDDKE